MNQEEIEKVRSLDKPIGTCSLTYSGNFPFSYGPNVLDTLFTHSWILDSGATNHMTPLPNYFSTTKEALITTAGQGEVHINPSITLRNVLHVPKLSTNLIFIQKLTKDLSCNVIFYNNACTLQNKNSGRMIGHAREWNGLYYIEDHNMPIRNHSLIFESTMTSKEKIQLHLCWMGHPSFSKL